MESMPPTRRAKINGAEQTSASHAKGPALIMMIDRSSPLAWKNRANDKVFSNHAIVAVVTAPTAELVEQAADRLAARLTARHGPLSVWFGIGKASGCGSIGWKRLATGMRVVVMRARSPPPGALRAACPGGGTLTDQSRNRATLTKASSAGE